MLCCARVEECDLGAWFWLLWCSLVLFSAVFLWLPGATCTCSTKRAVSYGGHKAGWASLGINSTGVALKWAARALAGSYIYIYIYI